MWYAPEVLSIFGKAFNMLMILIQSLSKLHALEPDRLKGTFMHHYAYISTTNVMHRNVTI